MKEGQNIWHDVNTGIHELYGRGKRRTVRLTSYITKGKYQIYFQLADIYGIILVQVERSQVG